MTGQQFSRLGSVRLFQSERNENLQNVIRGIWTFRSGRHASTEVLAENVNIYVHDPSSKGLIKP